MEVKLGVELPLKTFELPAPVIPGRPPSHNSIAGQFSENAPEDFASDAGVFHGQQLSISWRVLNLNKSIEIAPLELDARRHSGNGNRIRLTSPYALIPYCVAVSESGSNFVLDFVSVSGALNTVVIPQVWLQNPPATYPSLPEHKISRPHAFDLIPPRVVKAVSSLVLLVSLEDGELLRLDRSTVLSEPVSKQFADHLSKSPSAGGMLSSLFKGNKNRVPGHPSLSVDSAASIELLDNTVITYSVNHVLRVWSLQTNSCIQVIDSAQQSQQQQSQQQQSATHLRLRPSTYISVVGNEVLVALPHEFKAYEFSNNDKQLVAKNCAAIPIPESLRLWFLTSFRVLKPGLVLAAFKLNISAKIYIIDTATTTWNLVGGYDHSSALDLPSASLVSSLKSRILELPPTVVKYALTQLAPQTVGTTEDLPSLLEQVLPSEADVPENHTKWLQLDTLCRELSVQAQELLSISPALSTHSGMFFWSLQVAGTSLISISLQNTTSTSSDTEEDEALTLAHNLLSSVPADTFDRISHTLLSSDLVVNKVDQVCDLLRKHLDQLKLNEVGRSVGPRVAAALEHYISNYGVMPNSVISNRSHASSGTSSGSGTSTKSSEEPLLIELSQLGHNAVSSLVYDYAVSQASKFQALASLAVVAFVEGWLTSDSDLLSASVSCLRKFSVVGELGLRNLHLDLQKVYLEEFGMTLARHIIAEIDTTSLLARAIPPVNMSATPEDFADFERAASYCQNSGALVLLHAFAAIARGDASLGVATAQRVSLSRAWIPVLGKRPSTQAAWFLAVARVSEQIGANDAALWLAQYGESLCSQSTDPRAADLLEYLFRMAVQIGDISAAYVALTRRFRNATEEDAAIEAWLKELISAAARKSAEDATTLVVSYPFIGFSVQLQRTLAQTPSFGTVPSYKLRYAWHVEREDYVGAAQVIYNHLRTEAGLEPARRAELYMVCLNVLSLADSESRWLSSGDQVVTYEDVKLEQKALLLDLQTRL